MSTAIRLCVVKYGLTWEQVAAMTDYQIFMLAK